jgi:hypothetical protein
VRHPGASSAITSAACAAGYVTFALQLDEGRLISEHDGGAEVTFSRPLRCVYGAVLIHLAAGSATIERTLVWDASSSVEHLALVHEARLAVDDLLGGYLHLPVTKSLDSARLAASTAPPPGSRRSSGRARRCRNKPPCAPRSRSSMSTGAQRRRPPAAP